MIYLKDNAVGLDTVINRYVTKIEKTLTNMGWDLQMYHRLYKELTDNGVEAPFRFTSGKEYKEVLLDDGFVAEAGFLVSEDRSIDNDVISVDCDVVFSVNLDKLDNGSEQREDEVVMLAALNAVRDCEEVTVIKTGLDNVFSDFDTERIKFRDMQPFFNFSFTINIKYKNNNCYGL